LRTSNTSFLALTLAASLVGCIEPYEPYEPPRQNPCANGRCQTPNRTNCGDLPPRAGGIDLTVPGYYQQCQQWCWAAAASMVTGYYGNHLTECQFASKLTYGDTISCCNYGCAAYCNRTASMSQLSQIMSLTGLYHAVSGPLTEVALQIELSNGRPIIIELRGSFSGHAVVVSGYRPSSYGIMTYTVLDPWFGRSNPTYQQLLTGYSGGQARWYGTMYRLSPRADGCNQSFDPSCGCDETDAELPGGYDFSQ